MEQIGTILEKFISKNTKLQAGLKAHLAASLWGKLVDRDGRSWIEKIAKGILFVATENPHYCNEIKFEKSKIISLINDKFGEKVIKDIKIKVSSKEEKGKD